eukprot:4505592-Prorocentrum_lima.AAC.1
MATRRTTGFAKAVFLRELGGHVDEACHTSSVRTHVGNMMCGLSVMSGARIVDGGVLISTFDRGGVLM